MFQRRKQARRTDLLRYAIPLLCALIVARGDAAPADGPRSGAAEQLKTQALALVELALRRPYGIAWPEASSDRGAGATEPARADLRPSATPAAALLLHLAARELDDAQLRTARDDALRGIMAAQERNGRVPVNAVFARSAGGRPPLEAVPRRDPTVAALAVFLTVLTDDGEAADARVRSSAARMASWIARQQGANGAWACGYPPDAQPEATVRLIRLDEPDMRDATWVMALAARRVREQPFALTADRALDRILRLRSGADGPATAGLWYGIYAMGGEPPRRGPADRPHAIDALASRYALQLLIGAYVITGDQTLAEPIAAAAQRLAALGADGIWERFYDPATGRPLAATRPSHEDVFTPAPAVVSDLQPQSFGLPAALKSARDVGALSHVELVNLLEAGWSTEQRVALGVTELLSDPFSTDWAVTPEEARSKLQALGPMNAAPDGPELAPRMAHLWRLLQRVRLERLAGSNP